MQQIHDFVIVWYDGNEVLTEIVKTVTYDEMKAIVEAVSIDGGEVSSCFPIIYPNQHFDNEYKIWSVSYDGWVSIGELETYSGCKPS